MDRAQRLRWWSRWAGLLLVALTCAVQAQTVKDMRAANAAGHTRAVLDLSGAVDYSLFQLQNPDRIVIDFKRASLGKSFQFDAPVGAIRDVRTGQHGKHGLRVVLDLDERAQPKSFLLQPGQEKGYRLVVDLYSDPVRTEKKAIASSAATARDVVVVVDAGHGGHDPGAIGSRGTKEKNVTLAVAKALVARINAEPGMKALLTRDDDSYIALQKRYRIARQDNADLFISIHADAFRNRAARGSSVWVLSRDGKLSEAARWLARDNPGMLGGISLDNKSDTLTEVLLDLSQGATMQISATVANDVLHQLARLGPVHKNHVEHANFVVLRSPDVPSILVETAFITNPQEERQLRNPAHRDKLAAAILAGVRKFFQASPPVGTWFAVQARLQDRRHVVAYGETLSGIAQEYGVNIASLQELNHLGNANSLQVGAVLDIPAG